eukprot:gene8021-biopygen6027
MLVSTEPGNQRLGNHNGPLPGSIWGWYLNLAELAELAEARGDLAETPRRLAEARGGLAEAYEVSRNVVGVSRRPSGGSWRDQRQLT